MSAPHPAHVERIRKMKQRLAVRAWEYRQRNTSKGVWDRLRGVLALSERAFVLDAATADRLAAAGYLPQPVGAELQPPRSYFVLPAAAAHLVAGAAELPLRLDAAFLAEPRVALIYFEGIAPPKV